MTKGKSPKTSARESTVKWNGSSPQTYQILLGLGLMVFLILFIGHFLAHPTLQTRFITEDLVSIHFQQILVFAAITVSFCYFSYHAMTLRDGFTKLDGIFIGVLSLGIIGLYAMAFNPQLLPNGDNAEYLMNARSLVEHGAAYRLNMPQNTPNTLASLGLPLMLSPIYAIWGFDLIKMKIVVVLLSLALFPLLIFLFRMKLDTSQSVVLSTVVMVSPHLVSASSSLMTETPYIFWSILTLVLIIIYASDQNKGWKVLILLLIAALMTYLTRVMGITLFAAMIIYLFARVQWLHLWRQKDWKLLWLDLRFRKLMYLLVPLLLAAIAFQVRQQSIGVSQAKVFLADGLLERFALNFDSSIRIIAQMIFSRETFLWYIFYGDYHLPPMNSWWAFVLLITLIGFLVYLWKTSITAFYVAVFYVTIMLASRAHEEMVMIRYLTVLLPLLIFLVYEGCKYLLQGSGKLLNFSVYPHFIRMSALLVMGYLLFSSFASDLAVITMNRAGQGPAYEDYVEVARWSKDNLPSEAFVATVKPRIFWLFSDKNAIRSSSISEDFSAEYAVEKIAHWKKIGITHVVIDRISAASRENIYPIIEANQELFRTLYVASTAGTSVIFEINYQ